MQKTLHFPSIICSIRVCLSVTINNQPWPSLLQNKPELLTSSIISTVLSCFSCYATERTFAHFFIHCWQHFWNLNQIKKSTIVISRHPTPEIASTLPSKSSPPPYQSWQWYWISAGQRQLSCHLLIISESLKISRHHGRRSVWIEHFSFLLLFHKFSEFLLHLLFPPTMAERAGKGLTKEESKAAKAKPLFSKHKCEEQNPGKS